MRTVILTSGLPGSGKSTLISRLEKEYGKPAYVCSADDYWYADRDKTPENYLFDLNRLHVAHKECKDKFLAALYDKESLIVVDNTNIREKEYKFYFKAAISNNYNVIFHRIINCSVEESFQNNIHKVPREAIQRMLNDFSPIPEKIDGTLTDVVLHDFYELRGFKNGNPNQKTEEDSQRSRNGSEFLEAE